nr:MAG TPA: hypothetical protein [Caudoviricetes sp.]
MSESLEYFRDRFYECTIKANNLIDMILLENSQDGTD